MKDKLKYLVSSALHEMSVAHSPHEMSCAGYAELKLAIELLDAPDPRDEIIEKLPYIEGLDDALKGVDIVEINTCGAAGIIGCVSCENKEDAYIIKNAAQAYLKLMEQNK